MMAWYEAASRRRSRRSYTDQRIGRETLSRLSASCEGFRPYGDARVVVIPEPSSDIFTGIVGSYGKIRGALHVIAVIADESHPTSHAHAGYMGEAAILEATALGLDTCWVGGFFDPRKVDRMVDTSPGERVVCVSPVGFAHDAYSGVERVMRRMAGAHRRKPLETIAAGVAEWPTWARSAAECVRIAPSAVNRQPWRLRLDDGALVVSRDSALEAPKVTKALDCGIAMLHAELGALAVGVQGRWSDREHDRDVAAFTPEEEQ